MLNSDMSLVDVLVSLESSLYLEYEAESKTKDTINAAIAKIENKFNITIDRDIFLIRDENMLAGEEVSLFLRDVVVALQKLSLYIQLKIFHHDLGIFLSDVNYLGFSKLQLTTALKYLESKDTYAQKCGEIIPSFYGALDNISMCSIKRLFTILLMYDKLGIREGASTVSTLLYLGGIL